MTKVKIFDIQRFSYHDGPGIRTVVFLKGCNMRCLWCQNPESQSPAPEIFYFEHLCIGCGKCLQVCPHGCHRIENGQKIFVQEKCTACGRCAELCYAGALQLAGGEVEIEDILRIVRRDIPFYEISRGGVTLSGGEPFLQAEASLKLLQACKEEGIHTAVETAGNVEWAVIERCLPYIDCLMYDLKTLDERRHQEMCGTTNKRIIQNLQRLNGKNIELIVRIPVIPGFNDDEEMIRDIAKAVKKISNLQYVELLPFHKLGINKYRALGLRYQAEDWKEPGKEQMEALRAVLASEGVKTMP